MSIADIADALWRDVAPPPEYMQLLARRLAPPPYNAGFIDPFSNPPDPKAHAAFLSVVPLRTDLCDQLRKAVDERANVVVVGRRGSGKTSLHHSVATDGRAGAPQRVLMVTWPFDFAVAVSTPSATHRAGQEFADFRHKELVTHVLNAVDDEDLQKLLRDQLAKEPAHGDVLARLLELLTASEGSKVTDGLPVELNVTERRQLRERMDRRFTIDEVENLCSDIGVDFQNLPPDKTGKIRELLRECEKISRLKELVRWLRRNTPEVELPDHVLLAIEGPKGWRPYDHVHVFVDGLDKLAPAIQTRLIREAVQLTKHYQRLHFTLFCSEKPENEDPHEIRVLKLRPWSEAELRELLVWRVAAAARTSPEDAVKWPSDLGLDAGGGSNHRDICGMVVAAALQANGSTTPASRIEDAPVHALRLARGIVWLYAVESSRAMWDPGYIDSLIRAYWDAGGAGPKGALTKADAYVPHFQDRQEDKRLIWHSRSPRLVIIAGAPGSGKTWLLAEAASEMRCNYKHPLICYINCNSFHEPEPELLDYQHRFVEALLQSSDGVLRTQKRSPGEQIEDIVKQIARFGDPAPLLMFDNSDRLREDLLQWLGDKEGLVSSLIKWSTARLVFAGRTRLPLELVWDVAGKRHPHRLLPLAGDRSSDPAQQLVRDILSHGPIALSQQVLERLVRIAVELSAGFPELAVRLAETIVNSEKTYSRDNNTKRLRSRLAKDVVQPFVDQRWLVGLEPHWQVLFQVACLLPWFDPSTLKTFKNECDLQALRSVSPGLLTDDSLRQGILRIRREFFPLEFPSQGYRIPAEVRRLVCTCWDLTDHASYQKAGDAALTMWEAALKDAERDEWPAGDRAAYQTEYEDLRAFLGRSTDHA